MSAPDPEPLVLAPDRFTGGQEWSRIRPLLAGAFSQLDGPERSESVNVPADRAEALKTEIVQQDFYPTHITASAFAAGPVLRLAAHRPDLIRSLVLHDPIVHLKPGRSRPIGTGEWLPREFDEIERLRAAGEISRAAEMCYAVLGGDPRATEDSSRIVEAARAEAASVGGWFEGSELEPFDREALAEFLPPVQLVGGELTPRFVSRISDELCAILPNASQLTLPGAGHFLLFDDPARFAGVLMSFCLERHVPVT